MSPTDDYAFHGWAEVYKSGDGQWRARLRSVNGQVVATPAEGYTRKWGVKRNLRAVYGKALEIRTVTH